MTVCYRGCAVYRACDIRGFGHLSKWMEEMNGTVFNKTWIMKSKCEQCIRVYICCAAWDWTSLTKCFASSNLITHARHPTDLARLVKSESSEYAECGVKCSVNICRYIEYLYIYIILEVCFYVTLTCTFIQRIIYSKVLYIIWLSFHHYIHITELIHHWFHTHQHSRDALCLLWCLEVIQ